VRTCIVVTSLSYIHSVGTVTLRVFRVQVFGYSDVQEMIALLPEWILLRLPPVTFVYTRSGTGDIIGVFHQKPAGKSAGNEETSRCLPNTYACFLLTNMAKYAARA
jgi:hypothetical protein